MLIGCLGTGAATAAGFSIFEQGSKAMGMAGAFTAQADDPSALFHNVGGLAFFDEQEFSAGLTYITAAQADFTGAEPFPGGGISTDQETLSELVPHLYWVRPLGGGWNFGLAINAPFGLSTEWPRDWAGRFLSTRAALEAVDFNPNVSLRVNDRLGFGAGVIMRTSTVELARSEAAVNPFTLVPTEIATVDLTSNREMGWGWQIGMRHVVTERLTWGASFRSRIGIHYNGDAVLTQVPTGSPVFDAFLASTIPFGSKVGVATAIDFPETASVGVAYQASERLLLEVDANQTAWHTLDEIVILFDEDSGLDPSELSLRWHDAWHYRLGARLAQGDNEWRFGYVRDESPIPEETLSPLLPDSARNGFTVGWGRDLRGKTIDLALMYLPFDDRTIQDSEVGFYGTYRQTAWLLGATVGW